MCPHSVCPRKPFSCQMISSKMEKKLFHLCRSSDKHQEQVQDLHNIFISLLIFVKHWERNYFKIFEEFRASWLTYKCRNNISKLAKVRQVLENNPNRDDPIVSCWLVLYIFIKLLISAHTVLYFCDLHVLDIDGFLTYCFFVVYGLAYECISALFVRNRGNFSVLIWNILPSVEGNFCIGMDFL